MSNALTKRTHKTNKLAGKRLKERVNTLIHVQITLTWQPFLQYMRLEAEVEKNTNNWVKADWILDSCLIALGNSSSSSGVTEGILKVSKLFFSICKRIFAR